MDAAPTLIGTTLGAYRIEALLGEGAMGEVYRGVHEALARPVAIKTLKPQVASDRSLLERFFAEARAVNVIRHENIVDCTDLVHDPSGRSYIVMELLEGRTLGGAIRDAGRLNGARTARIAAQIAAAIEAAHQKGIVHRDLKPENVFLIQRAGTDDYVKVLDFGIARLRSDLGPATATQTGAIIGTPAYMSPEQVRGERAGPAADIYALGSILYHMLTGQLPFSGVSVPLMMAAHANDTAKRLDTLGLGIGATVADLVSRMMSKRPEDRPASMTLVRQAIVEAFSATEPATDPLRLPSTRVAGAAVSGLDATTPAIGRRVADSSLGGAAGERAAPTSPPRRQSLLVVVGVIGALGLGGAALWMAARSRSTGPTAAAANQGGGARVPDAAADEGALAAEEAEFANDQAALNEALDNLNRRQDVVSGVASREASTADREKTLGERERDVAAREMALAEREQQLAQRERDGNATPPTIIRKGTNYTKRDVETVLKKARTMMSQKGILSSDLPPGADDLEKAAVQGIADGDYTQAGAAADQLLSIIDEIVIDRAFLTAKLSRLSATRKAVTLDDAKAAAVDELIGKALANYGDGDYAAANAKVNKIYAMLR